MGSGNLLEIILRAKDEASGVLEGAGQKLTGLQKATGLTQTAFGALSGATSAALVGALSDVANKAAEDQASQDRLAAAVQATGSAFADDLTPALDASIKKAQDMAFTDDQARDALTRLTTTTGSAGEAMKLLPLAMDLARGKGIDLATASEIVGKVQEGNTSILKRYGIVLAEGATSTEALAAIQQKFAGQGQAFADSTAGSIFKVKDSFDEWRESIGRTFGPAQGIIALLPGLSTGFTAAGGAIGTVIPALVGFAGTLFTTVIPAAGATIIALAPILIPIAAIGLAIGVLAYAWSNNLFDIQGKAQAVIGFLTGLFDVFRGFFIGVWESLPGPVQAAIEIITAPIRTLIGVIQGALDMLGRLKDLAGGALGGVGNFLGGIGSAVFGGGQATGGDYMVTRPTLFLAGEAGPERATFSPMGSSGGGGGAQVIQLVVSGRVLAEVVADQFAADRRVAGLGS